VLFPDINLVNSFLLFSVEVGIENRLLDFFRIFFLFQLFFFVIFRLLWGLTFLDIVLEGALSKS
jgi:hypothetical protein